MNVFAVIAIVFLLVAFNRILNSIDAMSVRKSESYAGQSFVCCVLTLLFLFLSAKYG